KAIPSIINARRRFRVPFLLVIDLAPNKQLQPTRFAARLSRSVRFQGESYGGSDFLWCGVGLPGILLLPRFFRARKEHDVLRPDPQDLGWRVGEEEDRYNPSQSSCRRSCSNPSVCWTRAFDALIWWVPNGSDHATS